MNDHQQGSQQASAPSRGQHPNAPVKSDRRRERLLELYQSALDLPDPKHFATRHAWAELLDVGSTLAEAIKGVFRGQKPSLRELRKTALPAINNLAALHRQAARYAQLDNELSGRDADPPLESLPPPPHLDSGET